MDCMRQITNILNPEYVYSSDDIAALVACDDPVLLEMFYQTMQSEDFRGRRRVYELFSMHVCLHLLDLMVASDAHDDAIAALLHQMITVLAPDQRATERLLTLLYRGDTGVSWSAAQALALIHDDTINDRLWQQVEDGGAVRRMQAALALAWRDDARIVPVLLEALSDDDALVRELASSALGMLADANHVATLSRVALHDEDWAVRYAAVIALGKVGGEEVIATLITTLRDPDEDVRMTAANQLGLLHATQATDPLIHLLQTDTNSSVRFIVIQALEMMTSGIEALIAATHDADAEVRAEAAGALESYQDPRSFDSLIKALDDPDLSIRRIAADTLSELHTFHNDDPVLIAKIRHLLHER